MLTLFTNVLDQLQPELPRRPPSLKDARVRAQSCDGSSKPHSHTRLSSSLLMHLTCVYIFICFVFKSPLVAGCGERTSPAPLPRLEGFSSTRYLRLTDTPETYRFKYSTGGNQAGRPGSAPAGVDSGALLSVLLHVCLCVLVSVTKLHIPAASARLSGSDWRPLLGGFSSTPQT